MTLDPKQKRQARELALQILFQTEFNQIVPYQDFLSLFEGSMDRLTYSYAEKLIASVKTKKDQIDAMIQGASLHWKIERMALVDRNILRIAIVEMSDEKEPLKPNIAINEAVDIAKKFGSTDSGAFVNGLLDQIRRQMGWE